MVDEDLPVDQLTQYFTQLAQHPGVVPRTSKNPEETGWYVPRSLLDMGRLGAELVDYEPDPVRMTPGGLLLHEYQRRTITFLRAVTPDREGVILAADMGLGKNVMALSALYLDDMLHERGLVCGPAVATPVWCSDRSDAQQQFGLSILQLEGMKNIDPSVLMNHPVVYCHYGILNAWQPWIFAVLRPSYIIFDESHNLSNAATQRTFAARQISLCASVQRRYLLTGTPVQNKRLELWPQLAVAQPRQWSTSHFAFGLRYCAGQQAPEEEGGHWTFDGESNDLELRARLSGTLLLFTRYDEDVRSSLPGLTRSVLDVGFPTEEMANEYDRARLNIVKYLKEKGKISTEAERFIVDGVEMRVKGEDKVKGGAAQLVSMTTLISILSVAKQHAAAELALKKHDEYDHIVVFTWRVEAAKHIAQFLANDGVPVFGPISGEMPLSRRRELAREFADAPAGVYVATRGSSGEAINDLVVAPYGIMVDLFWNATSLVQAESRLHRQGQHAAGVEICYLRIPDTIDDHMLSILQRKADMSSHVAERNTTGLRLVRDLVPASTTDDEQDLDTLCALLMDAEEDERR